MTNSYTTNLNDSNNNTELLNTNHNLSLITDNTKNFLNTNSNPATNLISNNTHSTLSDVDRPPHSYIALISMAILSKPERKILLNEIYDWVIQHFPYYQYRTDKSWRNSIRHNLSLNECFIKVGKAGNGRGYYWSIHGANMVDFKKGDFRRRQARLRAKHDKASTGSKNSENSKSNKSLKNQQQANQDMMNHLPIPNSNTATSSHQYQKSFTNTSINNQGYYQPQSYLNQQQQQNVNHGNLSLSTNTSQDYTGLSTGLSPQGYTNAYHNMYQAKQPVGQQLNSFNYSTSNQQQSIDTQYNQGGLISQNKSYEDLSGTNYTSHYSNDLPIDNTDKFITPNNTGLFNNESLLTKANTNVNTNHLVGKVPGGSQSTSPSSSTSSTSSQGSSTRGGQQQNPVGNYSFYSNSYVPMQQVGQVGSQNSGVNSGNVNGNGNHYGQYLSSTFPWLPNGGGVVPNVTGAFLETLTSAAQQSQSTVPTYDLNTFPYHNSQANRI